MTREERENALHCLKVMVDEEVCEECKLYGSTGTDHCEADCVRVAIKALEQESCDDSISREEVLSIYDEWFATCDIADKKASPKAKIKSLPSVQPKTGHWIKEESYLGWDGKSYQCSICGRSIHLDTVVEDLADYPYCHCGARMSEVEQ